jgi:hypothetical protein
LAVALGWGKGNKHRLMAQFHFPFPGNVAIHAADSVIYTVLMATIALHFCALDAETFA